MNHTHAVGIAEIAFLALAMFGIPTAFAIPLLRAGRPIQGPTEAEVEQAVMPELEEQFVAGYEFARRELGLVDTQEIVQL